MLGKTARIIFCSPFFVLSFIPRRHTEIAAHSQSLADNAMPIVKTIVDEVDLPFGTHNFIYFCTRKKAKMLVEGTCCFYSIVGRNPLGE